MLKRIEIVLTDQESALAERLHAEQEIERRAEGCRTTLTFDTFLGGLASAAIVRRLRELEAQSANRAEAPVLSGAPAAAD